MKQKKSFVFHAEWLEGICFLPPEIRIEVYDAIVKFALTGEVPSSMSLTAEAVFAMTKKRIEEDSERHERTCERRREAGLRGGEANASRWRQKEAKGSKREAKGSKRKQKEPDTDTDIYKDNSKELSISTPVCDSSFSAFWSAYPAARRQRKPQAAEYWAAHNLGAVAPQIMARLAFDKASTQWASDGGRFIPLVMTWIHSAPWEDFDAEAATAEQKRAEAAVPAAKKPLTPQERRELEYRKSLLLGNASAFGGLTPDEKEELDEVCRRLREF